MNRLMIQAFLFISICPLLMAQQPAQNASTAAAQPTQAIQITGSLQLTHAAQEPVEEHLLTAADLDREQILKKALTLCIFSNTDFLSPATLSRALLNNKDWEAVPFDRRQSALLQSEGQQAACRRTATPDRQGRLHTYPHLRPHGEDDGRRSRLGQSSSH